VKRVWIIVVVAAILALCAATASLGVTVVALSAGIGMQLPYGDGPRPPLTAEETATINGATSGVFQRLFGLELALFGVVALLAYSFIRLARQAQHDQPKPWALWCVQICMVWKCVTLPLGFVGIAYVFEWPSAHVVLIDGVSFLLTCVVVFVTACATLGVLPRSRLTLVLCLALLAIIELGPTPRHVRQFAHDLARFRGFSHYGLGALVFPALIVFVLGSSSVARYLHSKPAPST
jgi:hypothetical protein